MNVAAASMRHGSLALTLICALGALAPTAASADEASRVSMTVRPDTIVAGLDQTWPLRVEISNHSDYGLYLDSLVVTVTPKQAGAAPRRLVVRALSTGSVSSGDVAGLAIGIPAGDADASVALEMHAHDMQQPSIVATGTSFARAFDLERVCPSRVVKVAGRDAEMAIATPGENANGAGVLLLPDEGSVGTDERQLAIQLARGGFVALVLAPPGAGRSKGPADFAGPASLAAAQAALDTLATRTGGATAKLAAWGRGHGGTLALLVATKRPGLAGVIAERATMDPWASYRALAGPERAAFAAAAGRDSAAWRARSPLANAASIRTPVLVLHGEQDVKAPASAAHALVSTLQASQVKVESKFYPAASDSLPAADAGRVARKFLFSHVAR